jgi:acyl carrier protein
VGASEDLPVDQVRVLDEIRATLAELGLDPADVGPAAQLADDLDLDSLDWVDLAMRLEDAFGVTLREERFDSLRTVQDVVELICTALAEGHGSAA